MSTPYAKALESGTGGFFTDGQAYERLMGRWSRAAGDIFLNWLALRKSLRWLDVGCGTGVFTELILERCAPHAMDAIDAALDQIAYAQSRLAARAVTCRTGDAHSLPYTDGRFDVAVMALVISFLQDPAKAVAEMKRVVKPGGTVATYMWDTLGKGYIQQPIRDALTAMGVDVPIIPGQAHGRIDALRSFFETAGLGDISVRPIEITVTYTDFDDFWSSQIALNNPPGQAIRKMSPPEVERLKAYLREHLPTDRRGQIAYSAHANAVRGYVPA
jgi:SAM-dependent methyltransferase